MNNLRAAIPFFMKEKVPPIINAIDNFDREVGYSQFTYQATLSQGTLPVTWSISGIAGATISQSGLITIPAGLSVAVHTATVTARDSAGSDTETFSVDVMTSMFAPSGTFNSLRATISGGNVVLTWNHPANRGMPIARYSPRQRIVATPPNQWGNFASVGTATTWRDVTAVSGTTYEYSIIARNSVGQLVSNIVRVTVP